MKRQYYTSIQLQKEIPSLYTKCSYALCLHSKMVTIWGKTFWNIRKVGISQTKNQKSNSINEIISLIKVSWNTEVSCSSLTISDVWTIYSFKNNLSFPK